MLKYIPIAVLLTLSGCKGLGDALTASRPVIDRAFAARSAVVVGDTTHVIVEARDLNGEELDYVWSVVSGNGTLEGAVDQPVAVWRAPVNAGTYTVNVRVTNESGKNRTDMIEIQAVLSNIPIVTISSPVNGQFIPSHQGIVLVQSQITAALGVDSAKCFVGSVEIDPKNVSGTSVSANFQWDVTSFTGSQLITVRAWSHQNTTVITGESSVQVSVEPVVGKTKSH